MKQFGLIGRDIAYSFSDKYFSEKFQTEKLKDVSYQIFDLENISQVKKLFSNPNLKGFNVTIPYKEQIIEYLDELSPEAQKIGAVNCVNIVDGKKIGHNTDCFGFEFSLRPLLKEHHQKALVFGDGGAAKAIKYVLEKLNIPYLVITRNGSIRYQDLNQEIMSSHTVLINCTPVGTYPNLDEALPIPFQFIHSGHLVVDLIYNPPKTQFLKLAEQNNATLKNGFEMLKLQADKSWEIWNEL